MKRFAAIALAAVLLVPMLAAAGLWVWLDPAMIKARLQDAALRATGRTLTIDGPVTLAWGLVPRLRVEGLRLANPPGLSRPDMATVDRAEIGVALVPLLSGRAELRGIRLHGVDVLLERDGAGLGNWERPAALPEPAPASTAPAAPGRRMDVVLGSATLTNAVLGWRDAGRTTSARLPQLTFQDGALDGTLEALGTTVHVSGTAAPLAMRAEAERLALPGLVLSRPALAVTTANGRFVLGGVARVGDLPVQLDAQAASLTAAIQGVLDGAQLTAGTARLTAAGRVRPLDMVITAAIPDLAGLGQQAGIGLPGVRDIAASWRVVAAGAGVHVAGPVRAAGSAAVVDLVVAPRSVRGTVVAERIDLDQWTPPPPPAAVPGPPSPPTVSAPPAPPPAEPRPLPWAALGTGDADVTVTATTLRWRGTDLTALQARAVLAGGRLVLDPAHAVLGTSPADLRLVADAPTQRATLAALAPGLPAAGLLALAGLPPMVTGPADLDVDLTATGADAPALLATLTGRAGLAMVGGEADLALIPGLAQATRDLPVAVGGRTRLRCVAVRTDFAAGQANVAALLLDSPRLVLTGEGSVGLADRTLAMQLRPVVGIGSARVSVPVRVTGPWAAPALKMEGEGGRAQVSIGDAGADGCGPALQLARNGRAGPVPEAEAPKPPRPADLLRGLLR